MALVSAMDRAPISTVGRLFMMDDRKAVIRPVPIAAPHNPCSAKRSNTCARWAVNPALRRPYTTRYMPSEKITMCQGASRMILRVPTTCCRPAISSRPNAPAAAIALTGMPMGSSTKKPVSSSASTIQPARNVIGSRMAEAGAGSWLTS
ncbi:hypothetical protein D3C72_1772800 [compost metagenome]